MSKEVKESGVKSPAQPIKNSSRVPPSSRTADKEIIACPAIPKQSGSRGFCDFLIK